MGQTDKCNKCGCAIDRKSDSDNILFVMFLGCYAGDDSEILHVLCMDCYAEVSKLILAE